MAGAGIKLVDQGGWQGHGAAAHNGSSSARLLLWACNISCRSVIHCADTGVVENHDFFSALRLVVSFARRVVAFSSFDSFACRSAALRPLLFARSSSHCLLQVLAEVSFVVTDIDRRFFLSHLYSRSFTAYFCLIDPINQC